MTVEIDGLMRRFGTAAALDGVSLSLRPGEFAALLGPSGSGKTTLLRILAGLDFPDAGSVRIAGEDVADVPARLRGVGVVFQHYALFRHMTVADNVAFGLRVRPRRTRPAEAEIARRVAELLELVQIPELARRYPGQVSGGQRQRVALARALAIEPKLLLLDEPFGALDALVRKDVRRWVRGLHDRLGITSILVTHDQEEAMELADRIAVMDRGRVLQFGTPRELLDAPQNAFVAGFVGDANSLDGVVRNGRLEISGLGVPPREVGWPEGPVRVFVRPEDLVAAPVPSQEGALRVVLVREERGGTRLVLEGEGVSLDAMLAGSAGRVVRGAACSVRLREVIAFSADGRTRLTEREIARSH
ncbi:sulfate/molybdate ABC transporter ATP-binding protein [Roseomonas fluvialis]|uniref:Sulfate/thiosulfate import ATP-binding protein CysA n=1 Tax=Roseomonas fluvialis TaxID=1750527 RepID=A0ABN6NYV6_9PROT|nr:ATP-binding cassette domain-containing protein [Roseomonas fluvialis]BDG70549.1 sulfate/thiosulfate import ATP-binding protein CysA [Roseomonas fluvialis]